MQNTHFILKEKFKKNSRASHFARNSKVGKRFVDWDGAAKMPIVISTGTNRKKTWPIIYKINKLFMDRP